MQHLAYLRQRAQQPFSIIGKQHEIVGVANVVFYFQRVFHPLVEAVHVHVGEELGGKVAERQSDAGARFGVIAPDDILKQSQNVLIRNVLAQNRKERSVIDAGEKFPDIALECPDGARMIMAGLGRELAKPVDGFVHPLPIPAGKRVGNKYSIEEWIQDAVDGVMQQPIAHARFVDVAQFWIGDVETLIGAVAISAIDQRFMKRDNVIHQVSTEFAHVAFLFLADDELLPSQT